MPPNFDRVAQLLGFRRPEPPQPLWLNSQSTPQIARRNDPSSLFVDTIKGLPEAAAELIGRPSLRAYAGIAGAVTGRPLTPQGDFQKSLYGTDKPITFRSVGEETLPKGSVLAPAAGAFFGVADLIPGGGAAKSGKALVPAAQKTFKGLANLSTKLIERFKGMLEEITPQQFNEVVNKAKKEGLRKADTDLIELATTNTQGKINLTDWSKKVETQLVPLTPTPVKSPRWSNIGADFIGDGKYGEIVYQSPIKTSAGDVHFEARGLHTFPDQQRFPTYFSHVRYEDMTDGKTRKILETQSDLMQNGRLEGSIVEHETRKGIHTVKEVHDNMGNRKYELYTDGKLVETTGMQSRAQGHEFSNSVPSSEQLSKLRPYESNDPLAQLRTFREEVKRAAQDGKDTLLIPSGHTAMRIEGLSQDTHSWQQFSDYGIPQTVFPDDLFVGKQLHNRDYQSDWIITDILGEGKFKAVPKDRLGVTSPLNETPITVNGAQRYYHSSDAETFDISGKVDTKHFVYKLNEEAISREARKMGLEVEKITQPDTQGEWWRIKVPKDYKNKPILAYGKTNPISLLTGAAIGGGAIAANQIDRSLSTSEYNKPLVPQYKFDRNDFSGRIARVETSTTTDSGSESYGVVGMTGDLGKYQVNPRTLKSWSEAWLGKRYTKQEFLNDPRAQEKFFNEFMNMVEKYALTPDEAAITWHRGWGELGSGDEDRIQKFKEKLKSIIADPISQKYLAKFNK